MKIYGKDQNFPKFEITTIFSMCDVILKSFASKLTELIILLEVRQHSSYPFNPTDTKCFSAETLGHPSFINIFSFFFPYGGWGYNISASTVLSDRWGSNLFKSKFGSLRWRIIALSRFFVNSPFPFGRKLQLLPHGVYPKNGLFSHFSKFDAVLVA